MVEWMLGSEKASWVGYGCGGSVGGKDFMGLGPKKRRLS